MGFSGFYRLVFDWQALSGHIVRIRIYGIIGFSGFYRLVFDWQALIRIRLGAISGYGENRNLDESEILKIPPILKILILTNAPRPFAEGARLALTSLP